MSYQSDLAHTQQEMRRIRAVREEFDRERLSVDTLNTVHPFRRWRYGSSCLTCNRPASDPIHDWLQKEEKCSQ